jgi:hypothetical protein
MTKGSFILVPVMCDRSRQMAEFWVKLFHHRYLQIGNFVSDPCLKLGIVSNALVFVLR